MTDMLFDPAELVADQDFADPKDLRILLFAGLVAGIEEEIAREETGIDPAMVDRRDVPPFHTHAWYKVRGMKAVLARVKAALQTREEWLKSAEERGQKSAAVDHLECARHRDGCAHCEGRAQDATALQRERDHLEQVRRLYVQRIHEIGSALDDPQRSLTLPQVRAALKRTAAEGDREWRRGSRD
jgi:hypothetical protein